MCIEVSNKTIPKSGVAGAQNRVDLVKNIRFVRGVIDYKPQRQLAREIKRGSYSQVGKPVITEQAIYAIIRRHDLSKKAKAHAA